MSQRPLATVSSWSSPKTDKGMDSTISGRGVLALEDVAAGEAVAAKGGHLVDRAAVKRLPAEISNSSFQIAEDLYLAALRPDEYDDVMMRINHSCEPNVGVAGNVLIVAMRDIRAGEELTLDYATFIVDADFEMDCCCASRQCRRTVKGSDWALEEIQERYRGWFSWHAQQLVDHYQASD
jgi:uncharacterized protein